MASSYPSIYLLPGEARVCSRPAVISTVLGSCVSITLQSPPKGIGGICHAMLPVGGEHGNLKYVDGALSCLLERFGKLGVSTHELVVKLFGGADMFGTPNGVLSPPSVGAKNVETALMMLERLGLNPAVRDVRGQRGRKLLFLPHTGDVYVKVLNKCSSTAAPTVAPLSTSFAG